MKLAYSFYLLFFMLCPKFDELLLESRYEFVEFSEGQTDLLHVFG